MLGLGDVSVAIAAAHPHRAPALDCTRYVIEEIKKRVPIWKMEHYADGTREWVDPTRRRAGLERMSVTLRDSFGRSIEYLRISVTDRCNFRCLYCMPLAGLEWLPKADILSYEEIARVVAELAPLGLRRLRVTGGEPTLRPDLERLIGMLRGNPRDRGHFSLDERREIAGARRPP